MLCDNVERRDMVRRGEVQEGGDIRIPTADTCCCMGKANTIL